MKKYFSWKNSDELAVIILSVMIAMQVSLFKLFAWLIPLFNYSYNPPALCVIYMLMIGLVYILVIGSRLFGPAAEGKAKKDIVICYIKEYRYLIIMLLVLLAAVISEDLITVIKGQLRISNILTHNLDYFYAFLSLPIVILMTENKLKWDRLVDTILILSVASNIFRAFVSVFYSATGIEITIISKESALDFWIRDNRLRIVPCCFICLMAPLAIYGIKKAESVYKKIWYAFVLVTVALYSLFIWQSRAGILIIAAGCAVILLFGIMDKKSYYIRWGIVLALFVIFVAMGGLTRVINSFGASDTAQFAGENRGHYNAYALFWGRFLQSPMGEGLTETLAQWFPNGRAIWMCDAGIMYSIVPMGIIIIVFYILMFARGIYIYIKNCKTSTKAVIAFSLTLIMLASEATMDCFFTPLAFMTPFFIAIVEYVAHERREGN